MVCLEGGGWRDEGRRSDEEGGCEWLGINVMIDGHEAGSDGVRRLQSVLRAREQVSHHDGCVNACAKLTYLYATMQPELGPLEESSSFRGVSSTYSEVGSVAPKKRVKIESIGNRL